MNELYAEYREELGEIVGSLVDTSLELLRLNSNFLPHGIAKTQSGELRMVGALADSGKDLVTSEDILPNVRAGLNKMAQDKCALSVATAENVSVLREGKRRTETIKVQYENPAGLSVAIYTPFKRKLLGGYKTGQPFSQITSAEIVDAWPSS
ncbi:MAG: hypothetical protein ACRBBK_07035 [Paracoccaceae bacterium]